MSGGCLFCYTCNKIAFCSSQVQNPQNTVHTVTTGIIGSNNAGVGFLGEYIIIENTKEINHSENS